MQEKTKQKNEEIKQTLKKWGGVLDLCHKKQEEINRLKQLCADAREPGAPNLTGMPKAKRMSSDVELAVERIVDVYEKKICQLYAEIEKLLEFKLEVDTVVEKLSEEQRKIITLRYWHGYTSWEYIARKIHYKRRNCYYLHDEALKNFAQFCTTLHNFAHYCI